MKSITDIYNEFKQTYDDTNDVLADSNFLYQNQAKIDSTVFSDKIYYYVIEHCFSSLSAKGCLISLLLKSEQSLLVCHYCFLSHINCGCYANHREPVADHRSRYDFLCLLRMRDCPAAHHCM